MLFFFFFRGGSVFFMAYLSSLCGVLWVTVTLCAILRVSMTVAMAVEFFMSSTSDSALKCPQSVTMTPHKPLLYLK